MSGYTWLPAWQLHSSVLLSLANAVYLPPPLLVPINQTWNLDFFSTLLVWCVGRSKEHFMPDFPY